MNEIRFSDLYRMTDQPTLEVLEKKDSDLFALRPILEKIRDSKLPLNTKTRALSLLITQDALEIESTILISRWKDQIEIGYGRVDINLIEEAVFILSRIGIHEKNVDELRRTIGATIEPVTEPAEEKNLLSTVKELGPKYGIPSTYWYIILAFIGYLSLKKLLK